ncbi:hypothetical protein [Sphingomonas sp.]|uniref:hypothetical protein n=1 Tax=Sphingomonas sp. TaxID=28214 RepID=UPI001B27A0F8|nr:hypothetical protein [Sphingomonas sp.]MBO9712631.1 hypothetical protein [Sphingomonas sp.]
MAGHEVSDSAASFLLANFINKHLPRGTGNRGQPQTASLFAANSGLSEGRLSELRHRKGGLPGLSSLQVIERAFFPGGGKRHDPAWLEWQEVREAVLRHGDPVEPGRDQKRFTARETWDLLMRPLADRATPLVRSTIDDDPAHALRHEHLCGRVRDRSFILPMPPWFQAAIESDAVFAGRYDLYAPMDFDGDAACQSFLAAVRVPGFSAIVAHHADMYAHHVLEALRGSSAFPPYNKRKLGLFGFQQPQRSGAGEGVYLDLDFYVTDYHTHRVMRRVMHELRMSHPALFRDDGDPFGTMPYLRYFTTSFGINVLATTQERQGKRVYLARVSNRQGNANQHGLWHVTANEGLNLDDVFDGRVDFRSAIARALCEELGANLSEPDDETIYLEFAIDRRNFEPFLSCLVHLGIDRETFYHRKRHLARDDRREFQEIIDIPFTEEAMIELLLGEPRGSAGFTSYGLNIMDNILLRNLIPKTSG